MSTEMLIKLESSALRESRPLVVSRREPEVKSILLTNIVFSGRTGTEIYTFELARALIARGYRVAVFALTLGRLAQQARASGIPVTDRIGDICFEPNVIHCNHNVAGAIALARFPKVPAIFVCHDSSQIFDEPLLLNRIGLYIAVDSACRERMLVCGVAERKIRIVHNGVDVANFLPRRSWRERPETALMICKEEGPHIALVQAACAAAGLALELVGPGVGRVVADLPERCAGADIVFAYSRNAMEAMSTGAFVIAIDRRGYGGVVDLGEVQNWPNTSLAARSLSALPAAETVVADIHRYDPQAAQAAMQKFREVASLDSRVDEYEAIYGKVLADSYLSDAVIRDPAGALERADFATLAGFFETCVPRAAGPSAMEARMQAYAEANQLAGNMTAFLQKAPGPLRFDNESFGQMFLDENWGVPEPWGVWAAQDEASLHIPRQLLAGYRRLALRVATFPRCYRLRVFINRAPAAEIACENGEYHSHHVLRLDMPEDFPAASPHIVTITLQIDTMRSPAQEGVNADGRMLGFALSELGDLTEG